MDYLEKRLHLISEWVAHTRSVEGHALAVAVGGQATYDMNIGATYIRCCVCDWEYEEPAAVERAIAAKKLRRK